MRRLSTGWEVEAAGAYTNGVTTSIHDTVSISTGYNVEISTTTPRSGSNKLRIYRDAANTAYSTTLTLTTDIPALSAAFSPAATINEGGTFSNSDTTLTVNDASGISVGEMLVIDAEYLLVTAKATNNLTVTRGRMNTTATTHADTTAVTRYGRAFSPAVTLAEDLDTTETGVDVNDASGIQAGDVIRVDSELMRVTSIAGNTLTVIRTQVNSNNSTHANGQIVQQAGDAFCYTSAGDAVVAGDCIVIDSEQMYVSAVTTTNDAASNGIIRCGGPNSSQYTVPLRGINETTTATHAASTAINCGWTGSGGYVQWSFSNSSSAKLTGQTFIEGVPGHILDFDDQSSRCWVSPFFNFATLPTGAHTIRLVQLLASDETFQAGVQYSNGNLGLLASGGNARTLFTPTVNTWYRMVIQCKGDSGGDVASGQEISCTIFEATTNTVVSGTVMQTGAITANIVLVRLGINVPAPTVVSGGSGISDAEIWFDDFVVNDGIGNLHNHAPGYREIVLAVPTAEGTTTDFVAGGGGGSAAPNAHLNVDDWKTGTGTGGDGFYNTTPAVASTHEEQYDHASTATLGISGVEAVQEWIEHRSETGEDGTSHSFGIRDSSGNFLQASNALFLVVGGTTEYQQGFACGSVTTATATVDQQVAWTDSEFDNAGNEMWIRHTGTSATERQRINAIRWEVAYNDSGLSNPYLTKQRMVQGHVTKR